MTRRADVLVVGGGFCGTSFAAHLVRLLSRARIVLVDAGSEGQFGNAFRTCCPDHVLNVPAGGMSAFADQPDHFFEWMRDRDPEVTAKTFVSRGLYREYLGQVFEEARKHSGVEVIRDEAVELDCHEGLWVCRLRSGAMVYADRVVLAFGNFLPRWPHALTDIADDSRCICDPWAVVDLPAGERVGIIGSGLTAVDVVLSLESSGYTGTYQLISRHGLLPLPHQAGYPPLEAERVPQPKNSVRALLREFREVANEFEWRALFDAVRPKVADYWRALDGSERLRFLRHLRSYWDVHRHRIAPCVYQQMQRLLQSGKVSIVKGHIQSATSGEELTVSIFEDGGLQSYSFDRIYNCTGSPARIENWSSDLLSDLLSKGIAHLDPTGMGLAGTPQGQVLSPSGGVQPGLYLLGMLRRGDIWESTAVPDLRRQAADLAALIALDESV